MPILIQYWFWLTAVSLFCFLLERLFPWRPQAALRPQIGQDLFWLAFNGHFLGIVLASLAVRVILWINTQLGSVGIPTPDSLMWIHERPLWLQFLVFLVLKDLIEWCVHNLLHRVPWLWEFHKLHHSIVTLDWIGNMRFHWMEIVVYKSITYLPLVVLGVDNRVILWVAVTGTLIGHLNHSNLAIGRCIREAFEQTGVTPDAVQLIETTDREAVGELLRMDDFVDVIIPRGGKALIQRVVEESLIPVIKHFEGICHTFVHREADPKMALTIVINAKVQRPGTCNALETLLVDAPLADSFIPRVVAELSHHRVRIRGCPRTAALAQVDQQVEEEDYRREYLSLECNIRVVDDLESATQHIAEFGSRHTDVIVTESYAAARAFVRQVDSSSVMVNASSRLADGGVYGLGAEIGISTDKLHAFGPMGVRELTTTKFVVYGQGAVRE